MSGKLIVGGGALSVSDVVAHACSGADGGLAIDAALLARLAGSGDAASAGPAAAAAPGRCDALARAAHTGGLAQLCALAARGGSVVRLTCSSSDSPELSHTEPPRSVRNRSSPSHPMWNHTHAPTWQDHTNTMPR